MYPQRLICLPALLTFLLFVIATSLSTGQHPSGQVHYQSIPVAEGRKNADPELETIRASVREDLLIPLVDTERISRVLTQFSDQSTWPDIDYQDVSRTGFEHRFHLENTLLLSRAYARPGTDFYQNQKLLRVIEKALEFWVANDFICDNWWWNEMGTPNYVLSILLVMDDALSKELSEALFQIAARANMAASGARPGGDLIQIAAMRGKQALYRRNSKELTSVIHVMNAEIKTTIGRGMKPDLSFHHRTDHVISTLTYGKGYTKSFAYWAVKTAGTRYALTDASLQLLIDHFLDGICASAAFGRYPDPGARNRELTRKNALAPFSPELPLNLLKASDYREAELKEIVKSRQGSEALFHPRARFFWHSEYFTVQRPHFFTSVRMHSSRNYNVEQPHNEEGLKNHHLADGSNFLIRHGQEYAELSPVWDWQKIPGTTVTQKPELPHWKEVAKRGKNTFTGGVTDGHYGAAAFDFASSHDPLKARKSWFFFDNEYVCLGSAITSLSEHPVVTTVDQRSLAGDLAIFDATGKKTMPEKGLHNLNEVVGVVHDSVGYFFFQPQVISLRNLPSLGSWREINHQSWATGDSVENETFTLWIDHGTKPSGAEYAYVVAPGSHADLSKQVTDKIQVFENSPDLQAVWHKELGIFNVIFYAAGKVTLPDRMGEFQTKQPCMVMLRLENGKIKTLTVSDPSRASRILTLRTTAPFVLPDAPANTAVTKWETKGAATYGDIALPTEQMAGASVTLTF